MPIELACEYGSVRLEGERVTVRYSRGEEAVFLLKTGPAAGKSYWGCGHEACIGDFYRSLERGTSYANDLDSVANTLKVMMRVYESAGIRDRV